MFARLFECLLIATVILAMALLTLRSTSTGELRTIFSSSWRRLTEAGWRAKTLLSVLVILFLAWNVVQVTTRGQYEYPFQKEHYPFTRFAMFTSPYKGEAVTFGRFIGYDGAGKRYEINPVRLFPALSHTGLYTRTTRLVFMLQTPGTQRDFARDELRLWDAAFRRTFRQRDGVDLTKIDFARVRHSSRMGEGAKMTEETVLWSSDGKSP